jgi:hypothetical protein
MPVGPARARPAQLNDCPNLPVINFGASVKHSRGFFRQRALQEAVHGRYILCTPAPDAASVNWKRRETSKSYIGMKKELVEKVIADDVAFLDAHPTRSSRANKPG